MAQVNAGRVRFIGRGEYDNSTQYYTFDLVNYNGNSYFAKSNTMGNLPTNSTYWQLVAEKGNIGPAGPTGNGIDHISLTSQSGATKVYTIYFTDGNTTTFTVQDGEVTQEVFDEEVERLKMVYNAMPKVSGEGTNLTLNNTAECPVYDIELSPSELEQATTTGKNLAPSITFDKQWSLSGNGNTRTITTSTYKKCEVVKVSPNTTYTISGDFSSLDGNVIRIAMFDNEPAVNSVSTKFVFSASPYTFTTQSTTNYILLYNSSNTDTTVNNLQLELGDTATSYEPYTYGASPNPQYPQEIHTVSGDNTVVVGNKNLLNIEWLVSEGVTVENGVATGKASAFTNNFGIGSGSYIPNTNNFGNKQISLSVSAYCDGSVSTGSNGLTVDINYTDGTRTRIIFSNNATTKNTKTMTSISGKEIKSLNFSYINGPNVIWYISDFIITYTDTPQEYVPYTIQSLPLSLGDLEYCKIGDYEDLFFKNVVGSTYYDSTLELDKWYLKKNIKKLVLNGTENWGITGSGTDNWFYRFAYTSNIASGSVGLSNYYSWASVTSITTDEGIIVVGGYVRIRYGTEDSVENLKTWLSTHNVELYYPTTLSENILLSNTLQTQLDNIQKALSYQEQTNVSQTNNDLPFVIKMSAIRDLSGIFEEI